MATDTLNSLLRELHAELGRTREADGETRRLIAQVAPELERLGLASAAAAPTPGGLEALAVRFEADHPAMAAALRQVADMLGHARI
jgi:hypothetical protein